MTRKKMLHLGRWIVGLCVFLLGVLGYLPQLGGPQWSRTASAWFLAAYVVVTVLEWIIEHQRDSRAAEDFYAEEVTEIFRPAESASRMRFFKDAAGNNCVGLILKHSPIPASVKLWEGGYSAPPATLAVDDNVVGFRPSSCASFEEYAAGAPIYQVRYFPKGNRAILPEKA